MTRYWLAERYSSQDRFNPLGPTPLAARRGPVRLMAFLLLASARRYRFHRADQPRLPNTFRATALAFDISGGRVNQRRTEPLSAADCAHTSGNDLLPTSQSLPQTPMLFSPVLRLQEASSWTRLPLALPITSGDQENLGGQPLTSANIPARSEIPRISEYNMYQSVRL